MKNINKKGISLIVLIITIIVIIILAAVVILTLSKNNPIESAKEAAFKEDIRVYQDELNMYITKEYQSLAGQRDNKITATGYEKDSTSEEYNNSVYKYLSSFKKKYENKIAIENDEIVYIGRDKKEREWTNNIVKMNAILTVKYVYENGEEAAPTYEETITDGAYEVDSPIIDGYEPDHYAVSDKINKDIEITVTYYPWSEGLSYEELSDGTYTVAGIGTFTGENLVIPRKYNGKDVSKIKENSFMSKNTIKTVSIPETINVVGGQSFRESKNIKYVNINAKKINSPFAFYGLGNLVTLDIGAAVEYVDSQAFMGCTDLINVNLYSEKAVLSGSMFYGCNKLKNVKIEDSNKSFKCENGVVFSKDGKILYAYLPGNTDEKLVIPDSVENINDLAFWGNTRLKEIEINDNVVSIKNQAFRNCRNLEYLKINAKNIESNFNFYDSKNLKRIDIGTNVKNLGAYTFGGSNNIDEVNYSGTIEQWNQISKNEWNRGSNITKVKCSDGEVDI